MEQKVIEKVLRRIQEWKRFYTQGRTDVNENSSWRDIFLALKLNDFQAVDMVQKAVRHCGAFSAEESCFLRQLPYYQEMKEYLATLNNNAWGNYFFADMPSGDKLYCLRYPRRDEEDVVVPIAELTIICRTPVTFSSEIYAFIAYNSLYGWTDKHVIIKYATEPSSECLAAYQEWSDSVQEF